MSFSTATSVVGSAADYGRGAAVGAGAGAAAGIIGVLATRNRPSIIYPETALTFQVENPVTINTGSSPQAFRFVGPEDYDRGTTTQVVQRPVPRPVYYGPGYYPYYPYYWGPSAVLAGGFYFGHIGFGRRWR